VFDDTRDFLQAHFYLSPRTDTPFWQANKELELAEGIQEKIRMFRSGVPINPPVNDENTYYGNFEAEFRNFWTNGSYYCIFAGMGVRPDQALPALTYKPQSVDAAEELFARVRQQQEDLVRSLPTNYDYLRKLHGIS